MVQYFLGDFVFQDIAPAKVPTRHDRSDNTAFSARARTPVAPGHHKIRLPLIIEQGGKRFMPMRPLSTRIKEAVDVRRNAGAQHGEGFSLSNQVKIRVVGMVQHRRG